MFQYFFMGENEYLSSSDTCVLQYEENGEWHDYFDIMEKYMLVKIIFVV